MSRNTGAFDSSLAQLPQNYIERLMAMDQQTKASRSMFPVKKQAGETAMQSFKVKRMNKFGGAG